MSAFLDLIKSRPVFYDGSMGATILNLGLTPEDYGGQATEGYNDYLSVVKPDVIETIHASFLEAGADVIETNTFGSSVIKAEEYGLGAQAYDINRTAAALARRVADEYSTASRQRFVVGSIGPSGLLPASEDPMLGNHRFQEVVDLFVPQVRGLLDGGVDALIIETVQDILELKATIFAARRVFKEAGKKVPIQASITLMPSERMLLGTDIGAALNILEHLNVDIIGLNCSTGPDYMREPARYLGEHSTKPVSIIPNAGLPQNVNGIAVFPMEPEPFARDLRDMVERSGVGIVGGCCGTTPEHIGLIVKEVTGLPVTARPLKPRTKVASMIKAIDLAQDPAPTIIGERVNTLGSRKVKRLVLADDLDSVVNVAVGQIEEGAHLLDVSVATTEREADEADLMRRLVKKLALSVEGPLVIDTTEANVVQDALEQYPGRAIINSINMENGRTRIENVMPLAMAHGAAVVALTIDEDGMAKTREKKLEVARKIYTIVTEEYGLAPSDLIFDALTFPLTTGDDEFRPSAVETIEGIRLIHEALPEVNFTLGISNVSFGINPAARKVVNAVFLDECIKAGLTMAIIHPSHVLPLSEIPEEEVELARDLVLNRREDALGRIISFYEGRTEEAATGPDPMLEMGVRERLHYRIVHRKKEGIEADIDQAVAESGDAVDVLNNALLPAMKEVGDKFGAGELILPFVLQSAEAMKKAVAQLENYLEKQEGTTKGTVVLATVYGDVHDIGKNLVNTILTNNGYTVHDLGKQVPISRIIDAAVEHKATAIGLSALLVSTSKQMPLCVKELHHQGHSFPVMIGGAAINPAYAHRSLFVEEDTPYEPGVFYAKDAFEGLSLMDQIVVPEKRAELKETTLERALKTLNKPTRESFLNSADPNDTKRSETRILEDVPTPPFWGVREMTDFSLDDVWPHMDMKTLFRLHWGGKGVQGEAWEKLLNEEFLPRLARMEESAKEHGWLQPRVRFGFFPCNSENNDLIIYDPEEQDREIERFTFPRQPARERLCLADYFLPVGSGKKDVVEFQIVTMGKVATEQTDRLQAAGDYSESYFTHGLSVSAAEGLAELVHQRVRGMLGIGEDGGKRYSWGYPSCPDLEHHAIVNRLLDMASIGVEVTEGYQFNPEQTTAAIVVHHPDAKYFALLRTGGDPAAAVPEAAVAS
ncbi:MAG TPA: methionine synthase [Thermomicrobiales bacterium]|nr:methionine synthase [Thermomicrobiales bacterium]